MQYAKVTRFTKINGFWSTKIEHQTKHNELTPNQKIIQVLFQLHFTHTQFFAQTLPPGRVCQCEQGAPNQQP